MALVAAAHSPALAALLPALEEEHGPLTAAVEAQYLSLLDELPSLTIEGIRRRPIQARATASGLQLSLHVGPGASVLYVRATRTGLLRAVRTRGAGQLVRHRTCAVRVPASCVLYVQEAQGS